MGQAGESCSKLRYFDVDYCGSSRQHIFLCSLCPYPQGSLKVPHPSWLAVSDTVTLTNYLKDALEASSSSSSGGSSREDGSRGDDAVSGIQSDTAATGSSIGT